VEPAVGSAIGPYTIVAPLGAGGMGIVYKAEDSRLRRFVALKFLSADLADDSDALSRFGREARAASALNHPNICTVHDIGDAGGRAFIVMEFLEGETLKDRLAAGPLDIRTSINLGIQIADALEAAHAAGIIHRDIKPANIFIGSRGHVKILDFGVAKMRAPGADDVDVTTMTGTRYGAVIGTAAYMAPEQARGEAVDHRADIWSVGLVLYEMITGARPSPAGRLRIDGDPELERIISKCLEVDRELRYQHAAELRTDLQRLTRATGAITASRRRWLLPVASAIVAAAMVTGWVYRPRAAALTDKDTIVLGDFANTTGDAVFDDTLRQGLAVQLQQSPFLSLISDDRISKTLMLMNQPPDARLTPALAQEVCVRTASAAVLDGSIAMLGSQYVIALHGRHCTTGDILGDEQAQAARKEDVLAALSQIASRFRTRVGESLATVEKHSTPLEDATTPSLEALRAYTAALKSTRLTGGRSALPLFERAIALDPDFASAHARLGFAYSGLGETTLARASLLEGYRLRHRASAIERFFIETIYDRDVTGNMEREQQTLELWAQTYPRDPLPPGLLSGFLTRSTGKYERAIESAGKAMAMDPEQGAPYVTTAFNQLHLNRLSDAEATIARALERKFDFPEYHLVRYFIAYVQGDEEDARQKAAITKTKPTLEDMMSHVESLAFARAGRLQEARRTSAIAVDIAQQSGRRERAAMFQAAAAVWEALYGNVAASRSKADKALALGEGRQVEYPVAFAQALDGDVARSRILTDNLAREFPEDTSVQSMYLPALRALFALNVHDAPAAIQSLQTAARFDLAVGGLGFRGYFGALYPIYVRGQAYLAARQPAQAAAEFQRIVDHRSIVLVDPMYALARLHLARALALAGDTAKAKSAYDDLMTLWKDADAGIAVIEQARAESARLR